MKDVWRSPTLWLAIAVGILLFVVWQADRGRPMTVRNAQVEYCKTVTVPAAKDAVEREDDLAIFAEAAAAARRAEGNLETADTYEGVVRRTKERQARAKARSEIPCEKRFPKP